ncbi:hypothetical protein BC941DRAFT_334567, partial [Chlamydoabsidia padenii]
VDYDAIDTLLSFIPEKCSMDTTAASRLIRQVSDEELNDLIKFTPLGKSPGLDGLPFEVYRKVFSLAPKARSLFQRILDKALDGVFPSSWSFTRMILLFKKGDPEQLANWRPLSLINTDAKLFTKLLANRLN